jgi:L,D-transpeptidase ErfK/SrfK
LAEALDLDREPSRIRDLYGRAEVGTPVRVMYKPLKVGVKDGILYVEAHRDYRQVITDPRKEIVRQVRRMAWIDALDWTAIERVIAEARGIPVPVSGQRTAAARESRGL